MEAEVEACLLAIINVLQIIVVLLFDVVVPANLVKDRPMTKIDDLLGVGEVEEGEVAVNERLGASWKVSPKKLVVWSHRNLFCRFQTDNPCQEEWQYNGQG